MRYAIYFRFNEKAEEAIRDLRRSMMREIEGFPPRERKMPPHLTLLVIDADDANSVKERFEAFAPRLRGFTLELARINTFESEQKVLFIEPPMSKELRQSQQCCLSFFSDFAKLWRPHVTLAKGLREDIFRKAQALAEATWHTTTAHTISVGLIDVNAPLEVLASRDI